MCVCVCVCVCVCFNSILLVKIFIIIIIVIINPLIVRVVRAPQMTLQPVFSISPALHCPLGLTELQACPFPDVALSSSPFHCALQDGFGQTWWTGNMTIPLQFASLYKIFTFSSSSVTTSNRAQPSSCSLGITRQVERTHVRKVILQCITLASWTPLNIHYFCPHTPENTSQTTSVHAPQLIPLDELTKQMDNQSIVRWQFLTIFCCCCCCFKSASPHRSRGGESRRERRCFTIC